MKLHDILPLSFDSDAINNKRVDYISQEIIDSMNPALDSLKAGDSFSVDDLYDLARPALAEHIDDCTAPEAGMLLIRMGIVIRMGVEKRDRPRVNGNEMLLPPPDDKACCVGTLLATESGNAHGISRSLAIGAGLFEDKHRHTKTAITNGLLYRHLRQSLLDDQEEPLTIPESVAAAYNIGLLTGVLKSDIEAGRKAIKMNRMVERMAARKAAASTPALPETKYPVESLLRFLEEASGTANEYVFSGKDNEGVSMADVFDELKHTILRNYMADLKKDKVSTRLLSSVIYNKFVARARLYYRKDMTVACAILVSSGIGKMVAQTKQGADEIYDQENTPDIMSLFRP